MSDNQDHREETRAVSPLLANSPREMPYILPDGYFESLPGNILKLANPGDVEAAAGEETAREEIQRLSPLLAQAMGSNPFSEKPEPVVDLSALTGLTAPVGEQTPSPPVHRIGKPGWAGYAAAAAVAGIMALAVFKGSGDAEKDVLKGKGTMAGAETRPTDTSFSTDQGLSDYLNASVDPILMTAEASDTLILADAFVILHSSDTSHNGIFDDIPTKDLYAYIEDMPDLSDTRLDAD